MQVQTPPRTDKKETKEVKAEPMPGQEKIEPIDKECIVCHGPVVEKLVYEFVTPADWPASPLRKEFVSKGLYCKDCGLKYEF